MFIGGFVLGVISLFGLITTFIPLTEGWKSEKSKEFIANQLVKQLKLTLEQEAKFRPLVYEELDRRWELRRQFLLESNKLKEQEYLGRAAEFLTEEQLAELRKILAKWQREQQYKIDSGEENEPESAIVEGEESKDPEAPAEERVRDEAPPE